MIANYVNGAWVDEATSEVVNVNPSDISDVVGVHAAAGAELTERAIAAAAEAFGPWSTTSIQSRFELLDEVGTQTLRRAEGLGALLSREEGKTIREGIAEATRAGQIFKFHAGQCLRFAGEYLESPRPGISVQVQREPIGVVGIVTPWNFPLAVPAWKIAPALAYGNTAVFKPASLVPGCAHALAEIIADAGCPSGVFNLVVRSGREVGETIV